MVCTASSKHNKTENNFQAPDLLTNINFKEHVQKKIDLLLRFWEQGDQ